MKVKKRLSKGQIALLVAIGVVGILAMLFGIACIMYDHLMEGAAIVLFDIVLVALLAVMIYDDTSKIKDFNLGTKVFTMRDLEVTFDGTFAGQVDVTLMTDGVFIEGIDRHAVGYRFDEIYAFSSDSSDDFSFVVNTEQRVVLSGIKRLHSKALVEAFRERGVKEVFVKVA